MPNEDDGAPAKPAAKSETQIRVDSLTATANALRGHTTRALKVLQRT